MGRPTVTNYISIMKEGASLKIGLEGREGFCVPNGALNEIFFLKF